MVYEKNNNEVNLMKKKRVNLPPREAPYETYALADKKRETPWGTTIPTESAVDRMRDWSEENKQ